MDEIETINIESKHNVAKLLYENELIHKEIEHLKQIYKDQFDSSKKTRALSKEHCDSLIAQLNSKSMKNADLKGQIQEKVFVTTTLQNELRRLKGKNVLDNATTITNATTIAPGMFKLDLDPLAPRLLKNRDAHIDYLKYTQKQADILRGIFEQAKAKKPLDNALECAYKHAKRIQDLLVYVRDTCPNANEPRLKSSTSASRSQPTSNIKNDRISQTPSSNMKNKVEVQLRRTNLSSNKKNRVKDPICDANVKHTMFTSTKVVPVKETSSHSVETQNPEIKVYSRRPKQVKSVGNRSQLMNFVSKFLRTVRFGNDQIEKIMGYGDNQLGNLDNYVTRILRLLFGKNSCFIRDLDGVDLLLGSRDTNLYIISLDDMLKTSPICLLSKASKTKSWLWHRRLSHLNFGALNHLAKDGLARGIPKLKFKKDHLCSACALGKSKKSSHLPKAEDTNQEKLYLLHMDLCGPMRMESINGKKYILVIVDDYSRFTWVKFLRSKDEAPDAIIKCIKNIQVHLNATVRNVRMDNGTEFINQTLREFYENVDISHQTSVARISQ
ncbi:retrovirus-related pol polyprotein from transposon TNT 1-94 [Tanacetum coccineum]